jgi:chromosome segregation ATPase
MPQPAMRTAMKEVIAVSDPGPKSKAMRAYKQKMQGLSNLLREMMAKVRVESEKCRSLEQQVQMLNCELLTKEKERDLMVQECKAEVDTCRSLEQQVVTLRGELVRKQSEEEVAVAQERKMSAEKCQHLEEEVQMLRDKLSKKDAQIEAAAEEFKARVQAERVVQEGVDAEKCQALEQRIHALTSELQKKDENKEAAVQANKTKTNELMKEMMSKMEADAKYANKLEAENKQLGMEREKVAKLQKQLRNLQAGFENRSASVEKQLSDTRDVFVNLKGSHDKAADVFRSFGEQACSLLDTLDSMEMG